MPTIGDDERQYWNANGLLVARAAAYLRRPHRNRWLSRLAAVALAMVAVGLLVGLAVLIRTLA